MRCSANTAAAAPGWGAAGYNRSWKLANRFVGHRDGIWEVTAFQNLVATASADTTVRLWSNSELANCLLVYSGHSGSVNSVRFRAADQLMLTCSGDGTAHLIRLPQKFFEAIQTGDTSAAEISNDCPAAVKNHPSTEPSSSATAPQHETETNADGNSVASTPMVVRDPTSVFQSATLSFGDGSHSTSLVSAEGAVESAPLAAADFLSGRSHLVTASWDRLGRLYDLNTGQEVHSLTGHDHQLTDVRCAEQLPVVVTSARDSTFRLWDFRTPRLQIHVQQAHSRTVSTAQFLPGCPPDLLISAGTDRICRLWDLRKCRSPLFTLRTDAGINRLAVLQSCALLDVRRRTSVLSTVTETSAAASDSVASTATAAAAAGAAAAAAAVSPSCIFALPLDNRTVRFIDISGARIGRIPRSSTQGHTRAITSVAWAGAGAYDLFTAGFDHQLLAWQLQMA
ncbi:hypothetical protein AAHC03_0135 [Spirometra sp. Aus1]